MDLEREEIWRRFWYPVGFAEDVDTTPLARTVLGTPIVLWRAHDVVAAIDRCPHRDAPLSGGWTNDGCVVCPYHGWEYGADGAATKVPQVPAMDRFPARFRLETVRCVERYGVVWVCLADPARDIPELPDPAAGWRFVREFDEEWATPAARLMENSFDPAHTVFVHRATFGDTQRPDVDVPTVEETAYGLVIRSDLSVTNPEGARSVTREEGAMTLRRSETEFHAPFLRVLRSTYPGGAVHQIVTAATPVADDRLRLVQWALRNDSEEDAPAAEVVAFDRKVTWEDQALLESIRVPYSHALDANVHIAADRPTVAIRRIYDEIARGTWAGLAAPVAAAAVPV